MGAVQIPVGQNITLPREPAPVQALTDVIGGGWGRY